MKTTKPFCLQCRCFFSHQRDGFRFIDSSNKPEKLRVWELWQCTECNNSIAVKPRFEDGALVVMVALMVNLALAAPAAIIWAIWHYFLR
jgi:hypothetical protein